ncbi:hypothetical protein BH23PLA1_BH23PLA1_42600 [soil metagenome]
MITLTRIQARRLRTVFRRRRLGIHHKGLVPPLVFSNDPNTGLRVRHHRPPLAVECLLPATADSSGPVLLPLDALADFEGKDGATVVLETSAPGRTVARWSDRGIPQIREYAVPALDSLPAFPGPPEGFQSVPAGLLDALAEASATTDSASTRYALDCLQLRGETGEIIATDGRQILIRGGFSFPWPGDVLVRGTPACAAPDLPRDRPIRIGKTEGHVVLVVGPWTFYLAIATEARFPRIENAIPDPAAIATRVQLDPADVAFLAEALDRLPGADDHNAPVTIDCNGQVVVRAQANDQDRPTELILARSRYTGPPARLATNRFYLGRALKLGFVEVGLAGPFVAVTCRDGRNLFLWQPLHQDAALGPADDAVRIASTANGSIPAPIASRRPEPPMSHPSRDPEPDARHGPPGTNGHAHANGHGHGPNNNISSIGTGDEAGTGTATLIQEAVALHEALSDARARAQRLIAALRRQRKHDRAVKSALDSLRQLKLQEVAE